MGEIEERISKIEEELIRLEASLRDFGEICRFICEIIEDMSDKWSEATEEEESEEIAFTMKILDI